MHVTVKMMHEMVRPRHNAEKKRQRGISLVPSLWERIDEAAEVAGVPANRVIEKVLSDRFRVPGESHETGHTYRKAVAHDELEVG